jgi:hypothetical protein
MGSEDRVRVCGSFEVALIEMCEAERTHEYFSWMRYGLSREREIDTHMLQNKTCQLFLYLFLFAYIYFSFSHTYKYVSYMWNMYMCMCTYITPHTLALCTLPSISLTPHYCKI